MKNYGQPVPVSVSVSGDYRLGDIRHNYADLSKIERMPGFRPGVSFEDGVARFCAWVAQQEVNADGYEASLSEMKQKALLKQAAANAQALSYFSS